jgi:anion-transporting  ArsA/GET3 family ATPase
MKRATGIDLLADMGEFFRSFAGMTEGFRERAGLVNELLADDRTAFVLVTSPRRHALEDAVWFHHRLTEAGMPFAGVIANRVHQGGGESDPERLASLLGDELAAKVLRTYEAERRLAERDRAGLAELRKRIGRMPIVEIPHLHDDVHDLDGLRQMDEFLFRPAPNSPRVRPSPSRRKR